MSHIEWQDDVPVSKQFGDIYYSKKDGLAESRYVFLQHNRLAQRWDDLSQGQFTIAESGFGTGLNFLAAWQQWRQHASNQCHLHFISFEMAPLARTDIAKALGAWPELNKLSQLFLEQYPAIKPPHQGVHHFLWAEEQVSLTLFIGDIQQQLHNLQHESIDAWFLDGFAPSSNPDMWTDNLFQHVTRTTRQQGSFATFTAAGFVRRGLQACGWQVERPAGIGHKREMLCGTLGNFCGPLPAPPKQTPRPKFNPANGSWFQYPNRPCSGLNANKHVAVIGAGIAGCSTAWSLARRGYRVTLIDEQGLCSAASGIPVGIMRPHPDAGNSLTSQFYWHAWSTSHRILHQLRTHLPDDALLETGAIHLATTATEEERQAKLLAQWADDGFIQAISAETVSRLTGQFDDTAFTMGGICYPDAITLYPKALCEALVTDHGIQLVTQRVSNLEQDHATNTWHVQLNNNNAITVGAVVLATGAGTPLIPELTALNLQPLRGQLSEVPVPVPSQVPVCYEGYLSPIFNDKQYLGASFQVNDYSLDLKTSEHQHNIDLLAKANPKLAESLAPSVVLDNNSGFVGTRVACRDHVPIVGPVPNHEHVSKKYTGISQPWPLHDNYPAPKFIEGLYINIGHGSKGLSSSLLCGEILAAIMDGSHVPTGRDVLQLLHPARFMIRRLKQGKTI